MSRPRKPWFRKSNKRRYIEVNGKQVNLGPNKEEAHRRFHPLMAQPEEQKKVAPNSLPAIVDAFLE